VFERDFRSVPAGLSLRKFRAEKLWLCPRWGPQQSYILAPSVVVDGALTVNASAADADFSLIQGAEQLTVSGAISLTGGHGDSDVFLISESLSGNSSVTITTGNGDNGVTITTDSSIDSSLVFAGLLTINGGEQSDVVNVGSTNPSDIPGRMTLGGATANLRNGIDGFRLHARHVKILGNVLLDGGAGFDAIGVTAERGTIGRLAREGGHHD
jgi:hypothetical protein